MGKYINEKDLEPVKKSAVAFAFFALSVGLLIVGCITFQTEFTLKWLSLSIGFFCLIIAIVLLFKLAKDK